MDSTPEKTEGIRPTLKRLARTVVAIAGNRFELLALEVHEARLRLIEALLWVTAVLAFGLMTLALITATVLVLFWENHKEAALVSCSAFYLVITLASFWQLNRRLRNWPAFSATLEEIKKDLACWEEKP